MLIWTKLQELWAAMTSPTDAVNVWVPLVLEFILFTILFYMVFHVLKSNKANKIIIIFSSFIVFAGITFASSGAISSESLLLVVIVMVLLVFTMYHTEIKRSLLDAVSDKKTRKNALTVSGIELIIDEMIRALQNMSKNDVGALIVLSDGNLPEGIIESGTIVNADITSQMVEAVFYPKAPLHDGAMVIEGSKIHAAGCFLPLPQNENLPKEMGSRHRAALGVTLVANVTAIVVSEETGIISIVKEGEVKKRYADATDIKNALSDFYWSDLTSDGKK
jgi:diadenylate cyclase